MSCWTRAVRCSRTAALGTLLLLGLTPIAATGAQAPAIAEVTNTHALGQLIYTKYVYLFQAAGMVLLVAMIGAIVLTHRVRTGVRKQSIRDQVSRRREDSVELKKVASGDGI